MNPTRRTFLRASGVSLALPWLKSLAPRGATAAVQAGFRSDGTPRRMIVICNNLGLHLPHFIPEGAGRDYKPSRYLNFLQPYRDHFTAISGVSHPEVGGGHIAEKSFLTTATHPELGSFKNSISADQLAADYIGRETRFPSLALASNGQQSLSWTRAGVPISGASRPSQVFQKLFFNGTPEETDQQITKLRQGQSIMDTVLEQAKSLNRKLNAADRSKFDEYLTSLREVETQMVRQQEWEKRPKPRVDAKPPNDIGGQDDVTGKARLMFDLAHLAVQTDSTRLITIMMQGFFIVPPIDGVEEGYHTVSHHGMNPDKVAQLGLIEDEHMRVLAELIGKLHDATEEGDTLLDRTMVLYGSNMGNASSHDNRNMPMILAGGGFRHGQHLAFDPVQNEHAGKILVSMLQRIGLETDTFGSATGTLNDLEMLS